MWKEGERMFLECLDQLEVANAEVKEVRYKFTLHVQYYSKILLLFFVFYTSICTQNWILYFEECKIECHSSKVSLVSIIIIKSFLIMKQMIELIFVRVYPTLHGLLFFKVFS